MHWKCVRGLVQLGQDLYKIDYAVHSFQRAIRSEAGSRPFPLYLNGADSPPLKNHPCFVRPEARQIRKKQSSRICGRLQHWRAGDSTKEQVRLPAVGAGSSINRLTNCWYTGSLRCVIISRMRKEPEKEPRPYHLLLQISRINNLACCPVLRQLTITGNKISSADDVSHLKASLHRFSNGSRSSSCFGPADIDLLRRGAFSICCCVTLCSSLPLFFQSLCFRPTVNFCFGSRD